MLLVLFQSLRGKCDSLSVGVSRLEDKCASLSSTVDALNVQLERSAAAETDLQAQVAQLGRGLAASSHGINDQIDDVRRSADKAHHEKKVKFPSTVTSYVL